ncbi:MAG: hypothetical protein Q8O14_02665 [bacterium]|nr:hypothetical protein [bacterium]
MKKLFALLGGCLVVFAVLQSTPAMAGAGCCPSKGAKAEKASLSGVQAENAVAGTKTCVVDGKTVTCTVNADGSCSMPAGTVNAAAGTKTCVVDGKTVTCHVKADGSCTIQGAAASGCATKPGACAAPTATQKAKDTVKADSREQIKQAGL